MIRKPITPDICIQLDKPIDNVKFIKRKKKLNYSHPLRKCYTVDYGITLVCDSVADKEKIEAYLMEIVYDYGSKRN